MGTIPSIDGMSLENIRCQIVCCSEYPAHDLKSDDDDNHLDTPDGIRRHESTCPQREVNISRRIALLCCFKNPSVQE